MRHALESDSQNISDVVKAAFGVGEGEEIAELVDALSSDPSAQPSLSLVAASDGHIIGHVLFTAVKIRRAQRPVSAAILAPLAVHPEYQHQGVGSRLIGEGLGRLKAARVELVFVLGYPGYYAKHGFSAAGERGFDAPHAIPPENADAWMVQDLAPGGIGHAGGQVVCADALNDPRYWRE